MRVMLEMIENLRFMPVFIKFTQTAANRVQNIFYCHFLSGREVIRLPQDTFCNNKNKIIPKKEPPIPCMVGAKQIYNNLLLFCLFSFFSTPDPDRL